MLLLCVTLDVYVDIFRLLFWVILGLVVGYRFKFVGLGWVLLLGFR